MMVSKNNLLFQGLILGSMLNFGVVGGVVIFSVKKQTCLAFKILAHHEGMLVTFCQVPGTYERVVSRWNGYFSGGVVGKFLEIPCWDGDGHQPNTRDFNVYTP